MILGKKILCSWFCRHLHRKVYWSAECLSALSSLTDRSVFATFVVIFTERYIGQQSACLRSARLLTAQCLLQRKAVDCWLTRQHLSQRHSCKPNPEDSLRHACAHRAGCNQLISANSPSVCSTLAFFVFSEFESSLVTRMAKQHESPNCWAFRLTSIMCPHLKDDRHLYHLAQSKDHRAYMERWIRKTTSRIVWLESEALLSLTPADRKFLEKEATLDIVYLRAVGATEASGDRDLEIMGT